MSPEPDHEEELWGGVRLVALCFIVFWAAALCFRWLLRPELQFPEFIHWFVKQDSSGAGLCLVLVGLSAWWARRSTLNLSLGDPPKWIVPAAAAVPLALWPLKWFVFQGYLLSPDEHSTHFQMEILQREGGLTAEIPVTWQPWAHALEPMMVSFLSEGSRWQSDYLPVNAILLTVYESVGLGSFGHLLTAGLCVLALAWLANIVWPSEPWAGPLAAVLLVSTPQFLAMGMTSWAMQTHLLLSIVWLGLFWRGRPVDYALALPVGLAALAVHQFHVHALIAAPFMLEALWRRRFGLIAVFGGVYGAWMWFCLQLVFHGGADGSRGGATRIASGALSMLTSTKLGFGPGNWIANFGLFFSWSQLGVLILCAVSLIQMRRQDRLVKLLWASLVLHLAAYVLIMPTPFHGWGYRYSIPLTGHITLIAVDVVIRHRGPSLQLMRRLVAALTLATLCTMPLRVIQMAEEVAPRRAADAFIHRQVAEVLLVDTWMMRVSGEFIRNGPYLPDRPLVFHTLRMTDAEIADLCLGHPDMVWVGEDHLSALGVERRPDGLIHRGIDRIDERLKTIGCDAPPAPFP